MPRPRSPVLLLLAAALLAMAGARAQTIVSTQVSEPIAVIRADNLLQNAARTIVALPNGRVLFGIDIALACLRQDPALILRGPLLVYPIQRQQCLPLDDYRVTTPGTGRLDLAFNPLTGGGLGPLSLNVILPPGEQGLQKLATLVFLDGFE